MFALELRRAFFNEGRHAFLLVVGGKQRVKNAAFEQACLRAGRLQEHDRPLRARRHGGGLAVAGDRFGSRKRFLQKLFRRRGRGRQGPQRSASAASIIRPVRIMSIAFALPTSFVSRCEPPMPGMTPSLISGWPNMAVSAAKIMSHIIASSQPPPSA